MQGSEQKAGADAEETEKCRDVDARHRVRENQWRQAEERDCHEGGASLSPSLIHSMFPYLCPLSLGASFFFFVFSSLYLPLPPWPFMICHSVFFFCTSLSLYTLIEIYIIWSHTYLLLCSFFMVCASSVCVSCTYFAFVQKINCLKAIIKQHLSTDLKTFSESCQTTIITA